MAQLQVPDSPKEYVTHYQMLLGVDYQADQTQVDRTRSPDMVNMISDVGGNPVKRDGYRRVGSNYSAMITVDGLTYGIYTTSALLTVSAVNLSGYEFVETATWSYIGNVGTVKHAFIYHDKIFIMATKCMLSFDTLTHEFNVAGAGTGMMSKYAIGESEPANTDSEIIPDTIIALKPDGTGGVALDDKNVMSIYQRISYQGNGSSTMYTIPIHKKIGNWIRAEVKDANGDWQKVTATLGTATEEIGWAVDGSNNVITSNVVEPKLTFLVAPPAPAIAGEDNVRVTFCPYSMEQIELFGDGVSHNRGFYNETFVHILSSDAVTFQSSRMFVADKYKVYYSDVSMPFVISDLSWFEIDSEVVGFTRSNSYLAVLAKDNGRSTIYLASEATRTVDSEKDETETYFTVKESNSGIGAIAPKAIATLSDEPMFLSRTGVFGILTNWTSEKYAINRSSRINRRLCKESGMENAVAIAFNDYYYLAINGRMYVLDGRHKESDRAGNKPLEAYYFEGLPAIEKMYVVDDRMYFADSDNVYTWNDDLPDTERYLDNAYVKTATDVLYQTSDSQTEEPTGEWESEMPTPDEGEYLWYKVTFDDMSEEITLESYEVGDERLAGVAVCARWCSAYDDDDAPQRLKTLMKKGTMVTLVPHYRSGCEITLAKDGDVFEYLGSFDSDLQTFAYIDFSRFTFSANAVAFDEFTKKKIKKYKRLQIQIENNKAEPFGLTQITKTYTIGNYAKR